MGKIDEVEYILKNAISRRDACIKLGFSVNGTGYRKLKLLIDEYDIDISIYEERKKVSRRLYKRVTKECPVCKVRFETMEGHDREKTVCSRACSNTHFRSLENNPNWKDVSEYDVRSRHYSIKYREVCFRVHKHKCSVCSEDRVVDVHHYDENKRNNNINNLIPLCPTHHRLFHSKFRDVVEGCITKYRDDFISRQ